MFKHILVPTDGSKLALKGVKAGVRLARALGARVTGVYVMAPAPRAYNEAAIFYAGVSARDWRKTFERHAKKALAGIELEARKAQVPCAVRIVADARPWQGILKAARGCDAIVVATHRPGGLGGLVLGSETQQLLARCRIPVLVCR
jgi:nucleotide-binding universal stress UspA family protein